MKTKCISVRLNSIVSISDKAFKITSFDGSSDIIPKSCVFGRDNDVVKSDAYWISSWILEGKKIQYSRKKQAWFDNDTKKMLPTYIVETHKPDRILPVESNDIKDLCR